MPKEVQNTKKRYEIPNYGMRYRRDIVFDKLWLLVDGIYPELER